ncbi:MAG: hypothetical protein FJZ97_11865 [Chloroflexi bacterium]|nr:hypothetical protein [Chloroflexota bacterium]
MIAWIGIVAALSFFVLWGGGILNELGRPKSGDSTGEDAQPPVESRALLVPEEARLQVFEDFIRSLPEDDGESPPAAAA